MRTPAERWWHWNAVLALAVNALLTTRSALAQPLQLNWQAPGECPSGDAIQQRFARLVQLRDEPGSSRRLVARSVVERAPDGTWTVHLTTELDGVRGERVLSGDSCAAVAKATALILAFAWDPDSAGRDETPEPTKSPPPVARPEISGGARGPLASQPQPTVFGHVGLELVTAFSLLPEPVLAVRLDVGVRRGRFGAELLAQVSQSRSASLSERPNAGGIFRYASGGALVCAELLRGVVVGRVCTGGAVERIWASGFGVGEARHASATLPSWLVGLQLSLPFARHFAFQADVLAEARLDRPRFVLDDVGTVFEVTGLSELVAAGLELNF